MSSFERKFGKYAIRNLSVVLVICYAIGYVVELLAPGLVFYLTLDPYEVLHGQVWRLVTWILIPPSEGNIFFTLLMLYFYCSIGTTLERTWGTYRYNVYIFEGILFTIAGSFLAMAFAYLFQGEQIALQGAQMYFLINSMYFSTYYINMSIFLAFAATFPDVSVLLMFIIPIKVKWLGIIYGIMLIFSFLQGGMYIKFAIAASLFNFIVFFVTSRNMMHLNPKQIHRRQEFKRDIKRGSSGITKHKCAICGRTEKDSPDLQFRFCSKCDGNYEYCEEHLYTHTHVRH
ncbi:MAG: rhomboid family intramembrane serine protease [Blautia sp.]|nr:rhomboid family intramembrane serine protease [Lachnoclostridium sp.]MCM1212150.1 rhomboid family intramembrane serine protease [Blautia sp.]